MSTCQDSEPRPVNPNVRLSPSDTFRFRCGPDVPCFTECCGKLELLLTPYDVLRLRKRLAISSAAFLDTYGTIRWKTAHGLPEILMSMNAEGKRCPFVRPEGCSVYEDRPGACRIYPLGRAATTHPMDGSRREFYFIVKESHCRGFEEPKEWIIREWISDQGMHEYNEMNDLLMELYVGRNRGGRRIELGAQHLQMFMMACYNLERFRDFIFNSPFLSRFEIQEDLVELLRSDDEALLRFAFQWLRFALFQEPTVAVKSAGV
jgi:uncharacterized protein